MQKATSLALLLLGGCAPDTGGSTDGSSSGTSTTGTTGDAPGTSATPTDGGESSESSESTGSDAWPPAACAGLTSPFLDADCLVGLADACRALPSQAACSARPPALFSDGAYEIVCSWSRVVRFADIPACGVESVGARCEAGLVQTLLPCFDRCAGNSLHASLHVSEDGQELIDVGCTSEDQYIDGPLGARSAVGAELGPFSSVCAPNLNRPNPPICACDTLACAAE